MKPTSLLLLCVVGFIAAVLAACCVGGRGVVSLLADFRAIAAPSSQRSGVHLKIHKV
jgi:hypothetical protein